MTHTQKKKRLNKTGAETHNELGSMPPAMSPGATFENLAGAESDDVTRTDNSPEGDTTGDEPAVEGSVPVLTTRVDNGEGVGAAPTHSISKNNQHRDGQRY